MLDIKRLSVDCLFSIVFMIELNENDLAALGAFSTSSNGKLKLSSLSQIYSGVILANHHLKGIYDFINK